MARLPVPGADNNIWGAVLNDFLQTAHNIDGTLRNGVVTDNHVASLSQNKIANLTTALAAKADKVGAPFSVTITLLAPEVANLVAWRAPFACRLTHTRGYRTGGSGATINARRNGGSTRHLSLDLSLSTTNGWMDGGAVQDESYHLGDTLEMMVTAVSGAPAQLTIQVDFETV